MSLPDHAAYVCWPPRDHLVNDEESGLKQHTCEGNSYWKRDVRIDKEDADADRRSAKGGHKRQTAVAKIASNRPLISFILSKDDSHTSHTAR